MTDSLDKIIDQVYYLQYCDNELCLMFVRNSEVLVADDQCHNDTFPPGLPYSVL